MPVKRPMTPALWNMQHQTMAKQRKAKAKAKRESLRRRKKTWGF